MNIAVIFAGGVGKRMKSTGIPKQFLKIEEVPIIIHTLQRFQECIEIDSIVIACVESHINYMKELIDQYNITKAKRVVKGGKTGQESIYNALKAAKEISENNKDIVLIHDGVRPIINSDLIKRNIDCVIEHGSAVSAVAQKETTVLVNKENKKIESITPRDITYIARAPQSFFLEDILDNHEKAKKEGKSDYIDSASLMRHYGKVLTIVECDSDNIKITTPDDYYIVKAILEAKRSKEVLGV